MTPTDTREALELKPCPFCGGEAIYKNSFARKSLKMYSVSCYGDEPCMADNYEQDEQGGFPCEFPTKAEAAEAWNRRADMSAVKVKPLEWNEINQPTAFARRRFVASNYIIEHRLHGECFDLWIGVNATKATRFYTLADAKAAAQADYERRILSALEPAPDAQRKAEQYHQGVKDSEVYNRGMNAAAFQRGREAGLREAAAEALKENQRRIDLASIRIPAMASEIHDAIIDLIPQQKEPE